MTTRALELRVEADGHAWTLSARVPAAPGLALLWLPALGVAARHYGALADALAERGVAVFLHEWRGNGTSTLRARRGCDWGYRELLQHDLPASESAMRDALGNVPTGHAIGGHSLGGQLAACRLALRAHAGDADVPARLWLVASGAPYWRAFPPPIRYALPLAYRFLPWIAQRRGALPGRRLGFGGDEAARLIRDWARTALTGRYAGEGIDVDLDTALRGVEADVSAVVMSRDWLGPRTSLDFLLGKLGRGPHRVTQLDDAALGVRADHFAWMKAPGAVVDELLASDFAEPRPV